MKRRVEAARHPAAAPGGTVLVSDGETRAALAAVRALGARGARVHVLAAGRGSLAGASRFAAAEHVLPDAASEPRAWAEQVDRIARELPGALVLPTTEVAMGSLHLGDLPERGCVAAPSRAAYAAATDKSALMEQAPSFGLSVPHSTRVDEPARLDALPPGHSYPVVVKARRSRFLEGGRWQAGSVALVRSHPELLQAVRDPGLRGGALLQEFAPGHGEGLFFLVDHGTVRVRFAHRRLREKPPGGGVSVLCESIAPDPVLVAAGERLMANLGWHGVAMLEFRRTPDGRALLLEMNPRLWGSLQLAIDAGVDFPSLLVALHRGEPLQPVEPRLGVRTRWLLGDFDHLLLALRRREHRRALGRGAAAVTGLFLQSFFDGSRLEVLRWSDPHPFWRELRTWRP